MSGKAVRIIGALGILWSLGGLAGYLDHVGMFGAESDAPAPGAAAMPAAITAAFAVGVLSGLAGSVGLVLLKSWAAPMLWLCFVASAINWAWVFGYGDRGEVPLGISVLVISLALAIVARRSRRTAASAA